MEISDVVLGCLSVAAVFGLFLYLTLNLPDWFIALLVCVWMTQLICAMMKLAS